MTFRQISPNLKNLFLLLTVLWLVMFSACGDVTPGTDTEAGALSLNIVYHRAGNNDTRTADQINCDSLGVKTIEADIYASDNTPLATGGPWECEEHHGRIESVPVGENRKIVIYGKNAHGDIIFRGDEIIPMVVSGQENSVSVDGYQFFPVLQSPSRDTIVRGNSMKFHWTSVEGAFEYHLVVSKNSDLSGPVIEHWTKESSYSPEVSELLIDETYYWRVSARDKEKNESKVSDSWSFRSTIISGMVPDTGQDEEDPDIVGEDSDYTQIPPTYTKLDASGGELDASATEWTMTRDDVTGLIWEAKTNDGSIHGRDKTYSWQKSQDQFIAQLNNDKFGGRADWRLPNIKELSTLVNYGTYHPAVDRNYFKNISSGYYWTITVNSKDTINKVWRLRFFNGSTAPDGIKVNSDAESLSHVIAVCGNKTGYSINRGFQVNGDGTVTDLNTGLVWQREIDSKEMTWLEALSYCEELVLGKGDYDDWRMPNIRELQSIVEYHYSDTAISTNVFGGGATPPGGQYWSSTKFWGTLFRWYTDFDDGHIGLFDPAPPENGGDQISLYVRAVRGGQ